MDTKQLYAKRFEVYQKALNRQEGDWMPTAMFNNGGGFFWGDKTPFDVEGDHMAYAKAMNGFLDEMWLDVCAVCGLTTSPTISKFFPTAENRLADDGSIVHLQSSPMKADEYDQLIEDPKAFMANVLLPRKYPYLFEDREKTKELLKVFAAAYVDTMVLQMGANAQYLAEHYGIPSILNMSYMINTPLDHLFDYFRGFRGTLTDLRRQPAKVQAALDAIWDYKCAPIVSKTFDPATGHFVAYSLGDFLGDAERAGTEYSVILDLEITKNNTTGHTQVTGYSYTPIFTLTDGNAPRVVQIEGAIKAYEGGYIAKVSETTYEAMKYAWERIRARVSGK